MSQNPALSHSYVTGESQVIVTQCITRNEPVLGKDRRAHWGNPPERDDDGSF